MVEAYVYIILWISVSCTMILFNKAILSQVRSMFPLILRNLLNLISPRINFSTAFHTQCF